MTEHYQEVAERLEAQRDELRAEVVLLRRVLTGLLVQDRIPRRLIREVLGTARESDYGAIQPRCAAHSRRFCPQCHAVSSLPPPPQDRPSGAVPKGKPDASG